MKFSLMRLQEFTYTETYLATVEANSEEEAYRLADTDAVEWSRHDQSGADAGKSLTVAAEGDVPVEELMDLAGEEEWED